jgi:3-mercaptopyruvate sulfurtransferase SseA
MSLDSLVLPEFLPADTVILYSEGGIHAAQGMYLLWTRGHTAVLTLPGGMESWRDTFPADTGKLRTIEKRDKPKEAPVHEREKSREEC